MTMSFSHLKQPDIMKSISLIVISLMMAAAKHGLDHSMCTHTHTQTHIPHRPHMTHICQVGLMMAAAEHGLVPVFEYVREEGALDNRIFTVQCKLAGLTMTVSLALCFLFYYITIQQVHINPTFTKAAS